MGDSKTNSKPRNSGNAARDGTEECNNSCEDDTTSGSESSVSDGENTCVEVLFCAPGTHPTHKLGMKKPMGGESEGVGGGGVDLNIISSRRGG